MRITRIVWLIALALGVVLVAPGEYLSAVCKSANCKDGCIVHTGWCYKQALGSPIRHLEYTKGVVHTNSACTDATVGGTPALYALVAYDEYTDCTPDCGTEPNNVYTTAAPKGKKNDGPFPVTVKTQCNKGSAP